MKILTIHELLTSFLHVSEPYLEVERLDIAETKMLITNEDESTMLPSSHIIIVKSPNKRIDDSALGATKEHILIFPDLESADRFSNNLYGLFGSLHSVAMVIEH